MAVYPPSRSIRMSKPQALNPKGGVNMSLENWMNTRKIVLLNEKQEKLFTALPQAEDFRYMRNELYDVLARIHQYRRESNHEPVHTHPTYGIPTLA